MPFGDAGPRRFGSGRGNPRLRWRPDRLEQIANLLQQLAAAGLVHGDTKATNFLIHNDRVHLIDLDGLRVGHYLDADIRRFLDNFDGVLRLDAEAKIVEAGLLDVEG